MRIDIFKNQIINKTITDSLFIFKGTDDSLFIMRQYYREIASIRNLEICFIDDADYNSMKNNDYYLFIYKIKKFEDEKLSNIKNLIIICEELSEDCSWMFNNETIEFPKLTDWMLKDYISSRLPGFGDDNIEDLFIRCNKDPYRIDNEIFKLRLFNNNSIYNEYKETIDYNSALMLDIVNCLVDKNYQDIYLYLSKVTSDFNVFGFISLLKSNFKKIIDIQLNLKANYESLGISSKQFWYYKYNKCNRYNRLQLLNIYSLLTSIDKDLKFGKFQDINIFDYIIEKIYFIGASND